MSNVQGVLGISLLQVGIGWGCRGSVFGGYGVLVFCGRVLDYIGLDLRFGLRDILFVCIEKFSMTRVNVL